jgi:Zn-dependent protease with chaperone function
MTQESSRWALSGGRIRFPDISSRAYEHPADRGALVALRAIPGFDQVLRAIAGAIGDRSVRFFYLASSVRVSPRQYPRIHQLVAECATTLDVQPVPELFVARNPVPNAMAVGLGRPVIVVTTGLLDLVDSDGLRFIVGHEVGHVLSGHAVYQTMLLQLINIAASIQWLPIGAWGLRAIIMGLNEWHRKAELTGDRAGLLCGQDPHAALKVHASLAGAENPDEMDVSGFLDQASEYESSGDVRDSLIKLLQISGQSHPLAALRAAELQKWAGSETYRSILGGDYPRRSADSEAPMSEDVKAAANAYKQTFTTSADPLFKVIGKVGSVAGGLGGLAAGRVRDWWQQGPRPGS